MYAIQNKHTGQVIDYCDTLEQASYWLSKGFEAILTDNKIHISVEYIECGGPNGYGHHEESFSTYGSILRCAINLYKWMLSETSIWGPDARDIKDYFRHCYLYINGHNHTDWLQRQVNNIDTKTTIYI